MQRPWPRSDVQTEEKSFNYPGLKKMAVRADIFFSADPAPPAGSKTPTLILSERVKVLNCAKKNPFI